MSAIVPAPFGPSMPYAGQFSPPAGVRLDGAFLNAAQAARYSADPVYRKHYYCNLIRKCNFGTWLTENMGYAETCFKNYSIVRQYPTDNIVRLKNTGIVNIPVYPGTAVLPIANASHFVGGNYVYPQAGYSLLLPPDGTIADIMLITPGTNSTTMTVRLRPGVPTINIPIGADVIALTGKQLADCECPSGRIRFEDAPLEQAVQMVTLGDGTGQICGDALLACQNVKWKYSYMNTEGCLVETEVWYGGELSKMYADHEETKMYDYLFDSTFGIITTLKTKSIRWNWADPMELTESDLGDLKTAIMGSGLGCYNYAFALGDLAFRSAQKLANDLATGRISYGTFDPADCKWINLHFCTISLNGITIDFYEECAFGDGKKLGANGWDYKNRGIGLPMCDKPNNCKRNGDNDDKMFTIVNFRDNLGRLHDNLTGSNGILNGENGEHGKNNFGPGCDFHEWTIKSTYSVEVSCPEAWVLVNFPA